MRILAENDSYLGFHAGTTQRKVLTGKVKYNNEIMEERDFIIVKIFEDNFFPEVRQENNANKYVLANGNLFVPINKSAYRFADYVFENYISLEDIQRKIKEEKEQAEIHKLEEEKMKEEENQKREREVNAMIAHEAFVKENAAKYPENEKLALARKIWEYYNPEIDSEFAVKTLLVLIDNIDDPLCKNDLVARLHIDNRASRKIFECVTGLRLPPNLGDTKLYMINIDSSMYKKMKEFKPRAKPETKEQEVFYIARITKGNVDYIPVQGERLEKYGLKMFIHKTGDEWDASSQASGCKIASGKTKTEMLDNLAKTVKRFTVEKIREAENIFVDKNGWSPLFA